MATTMNYNQLSSIKQNASITAYSPTSFPMQQSTYRTDNELNAPHHLLTEEIKLNSFSIYSSARDGLTETTYSPAASEIATPRLFSHFPIELPVNSSNTNCASSTTTYTKTANDNLSPDCSTLSASIDDRPHENHFYNSISDIHAFHSTPIAAPNPAVKMTTRGGTTFFETPVTTSGSAPRSPIDSDNSGYDLAAFNASLNRQGSPLTHVPIYANADFISDSRSSSNRGGVGTETSITGPENSFFVREDLSAELAMRARAHNLQIDAEENFNIPVAIEGFHNFFPLEPMPEFDEDAEKRLSSIVPFPTSTFRVTSEKDATNYCLRRLHDFKLSNTKCMNVIGQWKQLRHPNVANLRQVFTTKNKFRGGENSIVFIHDFCAGSETMAEFFSRRNTEDAVANLAAAAKCSTAASSTATSSAGFQRRLLPESTIWSFVIQLSSAIRAIHAAGLSCRVLSDPTKILFIDGARKAKINCVGVLDVVLFDPSSSRPNAVTYQQQEDLVSCTIRRRRSPSKSLKVPQ